MERTWRLHGVCKIKKRVCKLQVCHQRSFAEYTCASRKPGKDVFFFLCQAGKLVQNPSPPSHQTSTVILFLLTPSNSSTLSPSKAEDSVTITSGVSMSYSSSTDDTSSLGTSSAISQASTDAPTSDPCQEKPTSPGASGETEEEEKKDRLTEVPERSAILRTSIRSLSPFRRHSWGPGKNSAGETEISQRR